MARHGIGLEGQSVPGQSVTHRLAGGRRDAGQHEILIIGSAQRAIPILSCDHRQSFELVPGETSYGHADADGPEIRLFLLEPTDKVLFRRWRREWLGKTLEFVAQALLDL